MAGVVSGTVGATVFVVFPLASEGVLAWLVVTLGAYALIDKLGLLPSPFQRDARSILSQETTTRNSHED
jgi:hypothetical protein